MKRVVKFKENIEFNKISKVPSNDKLIEKRLEEILVGNLEKIEKGMKFINSQYRVAGGCIDILARDKNNILCIIELKTRMNCSDLVFQCLYYPTQFNEKTRMIVIAPKLTKQITKILNMFSYIEQYIYYIDKKNKILIENINERELECI